MHRYRVPASLLVLSLFALIPHFSYAASFTGPIIPSISDANGNLQTCAAGWQGLIIVLGLLVQFAISLGIIIFVLVFAYAGFLWVLNPTNPENRSTGRKMLINAAIGLVITLASWLIVNTVLNSLGYVGGGISGATTALFNGGSICIKTESTGILGATSPNTGITAASSTSTTPGFAGPIPLAVCNAANTFRGTSTATAPGTNNGRNACAWAVSQVVQNAGYGGFSSNVQSLEGQLQGGRGTSESQSDAVCGDIVVEAGDHHVGICENAGCTSVLSNSSSNASFTWSSGPDFSPTYSDGVGRFYRLNS